MATVINKHTSYQSAPSYGAERIYLEFTLLGQGSSAPIVLAPTSATPTTPQGSAEVQSITRTSAGIYVVTLYDTYYARIYSSCDIDDSGALGAYATIGNWTNLGCLGTPTGPATFTLRTWNASGSTPTDIPNNTQAMCHFGFKKSFTGAAA